MPFLNVEQLKRGKGERKKVSFDSNLPSLKVDGNEYIFMKPAQFDLALTNLGNSISIVGQIKVEMKVQCCRCLEDFSLDMDIEFKETYYNETYQTMGNDNEDWISYSGDAFDITPEVLRSIIMNLPMRFICHEQCRGLCTGCGINLNKKQCGCVREDTDPRLVKLKELFKQ